MQQKLTYASPRVNMCYIFNLKQNHTRKVCLFCFPFSSISFSPYVQKSIVINLERFLSVHVFIFFLHISIPIYSVWQYCFVCLFEISLRPNLTPLNLFLRFINLSPSELKFQLHLISLFLNERALLFMLSHASTYIPFWNSTEQGKKSL